MYANTLQLMLIAAIAAQASSDVTHSQELLLLPNRENLTSPSNSLLDSLPDNSANMYKLNVECSSQFLTSVKVVSLFEGICDGLRTFTGSMSELKFKVESLKLTTIGNSLDGFFIRFGFLDLENPEKNISVVYSFKLADSIPLTNSAFQEDSMAGNNPKLEQQVAEVLPSYMLNASDTDFIIVAEPRNLILSNSFKDGKLFLKFDATSLKEATSFSFQLIDSRNGLKSTTQILQITPAAYKPILSSGSFSHIAVVISVISFTSSITIAILALISVYFPKKSPEVEANNLTTVTDGQTSQLPSAKTNYEDERVLTESILIWNKSVIDNHKSHTLSTLETSEVSDEFGGSQSRLSYFCRFDNNFDEDYSGIEIGSETPDSFSVSMGDDFSVLSHPGFRSAAFL